MAEGKQQKQNEVPMTQYQQVVYALVNQIPEGRVSSCAFVAQALNSSPRAVRGALRRCPVGVGVPCHRVIEADGFFGGCHDDRHNVRKGDTHCPVCKEKPELLANEGVEFDDSGFLVDKSKMWSEFAESP